MNEEDRTDADPFGRPRRRRRWPWVALAIVVAIAAYQLTYDPECWRGTPGDPYSGDCFDYDGPWGQP